jgi:hypothetical protein
MCNHQFLETSYMRVCCLCGVEQTQLSLDKYAVHSAPLTKGYERTVRFRQKIDKLLCLQNAPPHCPVWEYLSQETMTCPSDVRRALRRYKLKNKHYDSIRLFTRAFTKFRVKLKRDPPKISQLLTSAFSNVLRLWKRYNVVRQMPFFSYDFLLRTFLEDIKCPLVAYCKPVTCQKRHARNNRRLCVISALGDDGTCYRVLAKSRFRSVKSPVTTPPCRQKSAEALLAACAVPGAFARDTRLLDDLVSLIGKSGKRQGGTETSVGAFFRDRTRSQVHPPDQ